RPTVDLERYTAKNSQARSTGDVEAGGASAREPVVVRGEGASHCAGIFRNPVRVVGIHRVRQRKERTRNVARKLECANAHVTSSRSSVPAVPSTRTRSPSRRA